MSQIKEKVAKQQEIIETQGQRIDELLKMIQEMKETTDSKMDKLIRNTSGSVHKQRP
jgi:hypothetical protein